jgi:hypothetical protein
LARIPEKEREGEMNKFSRDLIQGMQEAAAFVEGKKSRARAHVVEVPNEETIAAMREVRAGKLPRFKSTRDLLRELNEGD